MNIFEDQDKIISELQKNHKKILKFYKNTEEYLYRGQKPFGNIILKNYPNNRIPRDSNQESHDFMNKILSKTGFNVNRSNSIAVTKEMNHAKNYGSLYIIFPSDTSFYLWSDDYLDFGELVDLEGYALNFVVFLEETNNFVNSDILLNKLHSFIEKNNKAPVKKIMSILQKNPNLEKEFFNFYIKYNKIKETNLVENLKKFKGEVMITNKSYYAIEYEYFIKSIYPLI